MTLNVERLTYADAFETLLPEWEALDAGLSPRTPFTSPIWNQLWWKYFARRSILRRDECFVHALRDASGRLVAVAPLMLTHEPSFGPVRVRKVQFFGTDPSLTEIRGIVCPVERQGEVVDALIGHFAGRGNNWDLLKWSGIRLDGKLHEKLLSSRYMRAGRTLPDYLICLPASWTEFRSRLSNNTRKSLRKAHEFLDRDGHDVALRVTERHDELSEALERFFVLHTARAQATDMARHRDSFAHWRHRKFVGELVHRMGALHHLRVFQLEIDGEIVASRIAFALDQDLYLYFSGYDPKWRKYGIMTRLMVETIKWAIDVGFARVNLSTGKDLSKLRWKPTEIGFQEAVQISPSLRGQVALRLELGLRREGEADMAGGPKED